MRISEKEREIIRDKFDGRCAYSGTVLEANWQVDHVEPVMRDRFKGGCRYEDRHKMSNFFPAQRIINHYKGSLDIETFRTWLLGGLHERLKKLPKNPRTEKSRKKKKYLKNVAKLFGITEDKPFSGEFYFEKYYREIEEKYPFKVILIRENREMYCFGKSEGKYVVGLQENSTIRVSKDEINIKKK